MVLKKSKFGGNTGNTLRRVPTRVAVDKQVYETTLSFQGKKVKKLRHVIENLNYKHTAHVLHSLNKKKHWDLPISADNNNGKEEETISVTTKTTKSKKKGSKIVKRNNQIEEVKISYGNEIKKLSSKSPQSRSKKQKLPTQEKYKYLRWNIDEGLQQDSGNEYLEEYVSHHITEQDNTDDVFITYEEFQSLQLNKIDTEDSIKSTESEQSDVFSDIVYPNIHNVSYQNKEKTIEIQCDVDSIIIQKDALNKKYGRLYIEGSSYPRKFLLVQEHKPNRLYVLVDVIGQDSIQLSKIKITIVTDNKNMIHALTEDISFHKLVYLSLFVEDVISIGGSSSNYPSNYPSNKLPFSNIQDTKFTTSHEYVLKLSFFYQAHLNNDPIESNEYEVVNKMEGGWDFTCYACDLPKSLGTCLNRCGHCFCNDCWQSYLAVAMLDGKTSIYCLNYACNERIDLVTICSFITAPEFQIYCKRICEEFISSNENFQFCPTPDCDFVSKVTNNNPFNATHEIQIDIPRSECLQCQAAWCYSCGRDYHWPASCAAYKLYLHSGFQDTHFLLNENDSLKKNSVFASLRRCPRCKVPIEKNGGCPQMVCRCNHQFCWLCLQSKHFNGKCVKVNESEMADKLFLILLDKNSFGLAALYNERKRLTSNRIADLTRDRKTPVFRTFEAALHKMVKFYKLMEMLHVSKGCCRTEHQKVRLGITIRKINGHVKKLEDLLISPTSKIPTSQMARLSGFIERDLNTIKML